MYVDRLLMPVESLGPGRRLAIWLQGCDRRCPNCANPELWQRTADKRISAERMADTVRQAFLYKSLDGLTLTGGEPFDQPEELIALASAVRDVCADVLVFTGYTVPLLEHKFGAGFMAKARQVIDVVIDGAYIDSLNDNKTALRGSVNQTLHYWNAALQPEYERYMAERGRFVQNFYYRDKMISVGIHNKEE